jgi:thioredoxin 1
MAIDAPIHSNEANFDRVLNAGLPVLAVLWRRDGCPTCEQLNPALVSLAKTYAGKALIVKVNVDEEPGLAARLAASQLPGLVFFKAGKEVGRGAGAASERDLAAWLEHLANNGSRPSAPTGPSVAHRGSPSYEQGHFGTEGAPRPGATSPGGATTGAASGVKTEPRVLTDANFAQTIRAAGVPVLVDFWAVWCGPCKMVAPHVAALAQEFAGRAIVGKLNVDENPHVAGQYGIMSIPTLLIFKDGKVVDQIVGAQPGHVLRQRLARQVS